MKQDGRVSMFLNREYIVKVGGEKHRDDMQDCSLLDMYFHLDDLLDTIDDNELFDSI